MAQATETAAHWAHRRQRWLDRVEDLVREIADWAEREGWKIQREQKRVQENNLGLYEVPALTVTLPDGELSVNPVGLQVIGGDGRIDLKGYPTLSRVKLIGTPNGWQIMTDSNVPIRAPWNHDTFVQLAHDLLS